MAAVTRSPTWPLVALSLALYLAYDLGAQAIDNVPVFAPPPRHISLQTDVQYRSGEALFEVPAGWTFVLKDLLAANTRGNAFGRDEAGADMYPSLGDGRGHLKLAGSNLRDFPKGSNPFGLGSPSGGGSIGTVVGSQAGVSLSGGVVFESGTTVTVYDYVGPLYIDGELHPH